jgi:PBP1b-binding outer membrane lipoprotein LpoB
MKKLKTMKKSIYLIVAIIFATGLMLTGCSSPSEKVENAQEKVDKANQNLDQAKEDYIVDVEKYRKETAEKIAANEKIEADFNTRIMNDRIEARDEYKKKVAVLDQKDTDMKKRMAEYKLEGKDKWASFKEGFNKDMDALGQEWKDLTTNKAK